MATKNSQRIAIWVIAIVMAVGSLGAYVAIILQNNNDQKDLVKEQQQLDEQQQQTQATLAPLPGFETIKFDPATATELQKKDLVVGTGEEVPVGAMVKVNYFGNLPDGTLFDSTNKAGTVSPIEISLDGVIVGWKEGVPGMKVGGKRQLIIPGEKAYGATGRQPVIAPNTPLAFVIEVVEIVK